MLALVAVEAPMVAAVGDGFAAAKVVQAVVAGNMGRWWRFRRFWLVHDRGRRIRVWAAAVVESEEWELLGGVGKVVCVAKEKSD